MKLKLICLTLLLYSCTALEIQETMDALGGSTALTNEEVIAGLKQALEVSAERSVNLTSMTDGFLENPLIRIPFPEEAIKVKNTLLDLGMTSIVDEFEVTLNHAAEEASKEAVPVFISAIQGMTISDGYEILRGGNNAATNYLRDKTSAELMTKFRPVVERATDKVALTDHWEPLSKAYNTATLLIGGSDQVDPDLDAYVTNKAIDGLFVMLAREEKNIRQDPVARTTDLLRKVFGSQQN